MGTVKLHIIGMDIPTLKLLRAVIMQFSMMNTVTHWYWVRVEPSAKLREWIKKQNFKRIWAVGTHAHRPCERNH